MPPTPSWPTKEAPAGHLDAGIVKQGPGGQSDKLNVRGTAELNGALDLDLEPGIYPKNQNYNLIHSDGGLSGFFN